MVVCRYWEQGNCRFGQNCRFEHPSGGRNQGGNRFAAFSNTSGGGAFGGGGANTTNPYNISKEVIERDLTSETPTWVFSAYGPSRDAPEQLFGGPEREKSFEEMRLLHLMAEASGNPQQAVNEAQQLYAQCQQQNQTILRDLDGAIKFVVAAGDKHPNRNDICKQGTSTGNTGAFAKGAQTPSAFGQASPFSSGANAANNANPFSQNNQSQTQSSSPFGGGAATSNPFGQPAQSGGSSAFGQPSALGQKANPFGTPAFGQTSQPTSAFGQTSQPAPAFGQPAFGQTSQPSSAFGQAAQSNTTSAFGQPSALGQKASPFGAPAFGQSAQPSGGQSAFGQPSALGQKASPFGGAGANTTSPFGGAAASSGASPFASANSNGTNNSSPFAQANSNQNNASPFGQTAQTAPTSSPFGQATQPAASSPFGQASQQAASSPFAQASKPAASSPFGQPAQNASPSPFGQTSQPAQNAASSPFAQASGNQNSSSGVNPFGQNQGQQNKPSPFGQPSGGGSGFGGQAAAANPFGAGSAAAAPASSQGEASPYPPGSAKQHPSLSSYASKGMNGQLSQWKGRPVAYKDSVPGYQGQNGVWTKIWFPNGAPAYYKDTELAPEEYDDKARAQWKGFEQTGTFTDGVMPELPPMREVCSWDI